MGSLTTCLKKAGDAIAAEDKKTILARAAALRKEGLNAADAAVKAVDEIIGDVEGKLATRSPADDNTLREPDGPAYTDRPYETDLFGNPVPEAARANSRRRAAAENGNVDAAAGVSAPAGTYATRTQLVATRQQQLGHIGPIKSLGDSANALAYLRTSAVERFDALVTDAKGKPLAIIGGFKGALTQTSVYPSTLIGEAMQVPGAVNLWLVHNHPSGTTDLSRADEMLTSTVAQVFDGTGVSVRGIVAVGADRWSGRDVDGGGPHESGRLDPAAGPSVSAQERQVVKADKLAAAIRSPSDAKRAVAELVAQHGGRSGIVLTDAQHTPIAFVPWAAGDALPLKGNGKLDALYRAAALANAGAAIIATGDTMSAREARNLGRGLANVDVRVLDIIDAKGESATERGEKLTGQTLFSRGGATRPAQRASMTQEIVDAITAGWENSPPVIVLGSMAEAPESARRANEAQLSQGADGEPAAFIMAGKVYIVASQMQSTGDVAKALFHEALGHYGLRGVFGPQLNGVLRQMIALRPDEVRAKAKAYGLDMNDERERLRAAEEVLAELAQTAPESTWVQRAIAAIRTWLREHVPMLDKLTLSDAEIIEQFIVPARRYVERGPDEARAFADTQPVEFQRTASAPDSEAFKRWFGDSKVVGADGKPLVLYHGTNTDVREFKSKAELLSQEGGNHGIYFTPKPSYADAYARGRGADKANREGGNIAPVYLRIENPKVIDANARSFEERFESAHVSSEAIASLKKQGYDGIINHALDEYVVFDPTQIKSAIGNRGTYQPESADIAFQRKYTPEQQDALRRAGVGGPPKLADKTRLAWGRAMDLLHDRAELAQTFRQGALDQFAGIDRAIQREIGSLPVEQDPYVTARLANGGTSSVMRALLLHGQAKWANNGQHLEKVDGTVGLLDILKPLGDDLNDWFGWMIGNRAARLKTEGRENNFTDDQIKTLQALATGKEAAFQKAAIEYAAFKRSVLDVAQQAGLLDPVARTAWDHADYIPFYRQIDERASFSATGRKGLAGQSSGIRTLKGGEAALNDPMENLLMNFSRLIDASLKNNALRKTIAALAETDAVEKTGYAMTGEIVPAGQVRKVLIDAGTPESVLAVIPQEAFDGMAKMWAIQPPADPDVIRVMEGGKPQFYRVNDPLLLRSLTSFVPFDFPGLGVMRAFKRMLTATVTATPEFMLRNFIRDTLASQGITNDGFNPVKSITGIAKSYAEMGGFETMLFAGASFQSGNINAADPTSTAIAMRRALRSKGFDATSIDAFMGSLVDTPAKLWEKYRQVGEAIENANREAVFEAAVKGGKSSTAAVFEAKDLMDFNLRGGWAAYQLLADVLPFFNARVQGMYRLSRSDPKRLATYGLLLTAASVMLALANGGEQWYEELPDWDKDNYWHFKIKGHHFRIPKPFEIGAAFATVPERITRYLKHLDTGSKTGARLWATLRDQLAFDPVPQMARPALNVYANRDSFRDTPIENMSDEGKLPSMRYGRTTSDTARVAVQAIAPLADEIGLSPKRLEYLIAGYFGTAGTYALGLSDLAVRKLEGKPATPAPRLDDLPIVKSFYRVDPARATVYESDLYKLREEVERVYKSVSAAEREGDVAQRETIAKRNQPKLAARDTINSGAKALRDLNKERDAVYADRNMTPQQKRERVDAIQVQKNAIAKRTMESPPVKAAQ